MRNLLHVLISLAMWCLFGYYWVVVLEREVGPETVRAMIILNIAVVAGLVITVLWILHNRRLARKFEGRRQGVPPGPSPELSSDTIGRSVEHPGLDELRAARCIDIHADEDGKTYTITADGETP